MATLLVSLVDTLALVVSCQDFEADALWHGECPCFRARDALLSHVVLSALVLPAGAGPHLPSE